MAWMATLDPPHPGQRVRTCCETSGLSVTDAAGVLGVTRQALNNLVNGKSGISAKMAIRLEKAFGGSAEEWLQQQLAYDLAQVRKREHTLKVRQARRLPDLQQRLF